VWMVEASSCHATWSLLQNVSIGAIGDQRVYVAVVGFYRTFSHLLSLIFLFVILDLTTCVAVSWRTVSL
jgi:hypothetical protein